MPSQKRLVHVNRNDRNKVLAVSASGALFMHAGTSDTKWLLLEEHLILNSKSVLSSRFAGDSFLLVVGSFVATGAICNLTVISGGMKAAESPAELSEWNVAHKVYTLPLESADHFDFKIAISKTLDVICLAAAFRDPKLNCLTFVNPRNGKMSKVPLSGAGCPVEDPTLKDRLRNLLLASYEFINHNT